MFSLIIDLFWFDLVVSKMRVFEIEVYGSKLKFMYSMIFYK